MSETARPNLERSGEITPEIVAEHGLSEAEYDRVIEVLGREPNLLELGIFSVMWSEHCSYKSSKIWLKTLPTEGPQVILGPGENAGVIDIGEGLAAIFKMESHNHPSFIEPYQGAATGVGGILRDVFTMGARPIANLNALRFGDPDHPRTRHLVAGVVAGVGGYGNCVGVPTVGGEVNFDPGYNGNILVNAMTVGIARKDRIFTSGASGIGTPIVYVGSKTGRAGIHGPTTAHNCSLPGRYSTSRAEEAMSWVKRSGNDRRYGLPVSGLVLAGPLEPLQLPRELTQMTKFRSVSMGRPEPIMGSHQPSVGSAALLAACALGDRPVRINTALDRSALSSPQVSKAISRRGIWPPLAKRNVFSRWRYRVAPFCFGLA